MKKLHLKDFKAYDDLKIDFKISNTVENGNFLLYGENGAGKSSIYEAIKIIFYKNKLSEDIPTAATPEEQEENTKSFWRKYNNKKTQNDFNIEINGEDYKDFSLVSHQVFMIAVDKFCINGAIRLDKLLEDFYFPITDLNQFCRDNYESIQSNINDKLKEFKEENIEIIIDNEDDFTIQIKDSIRNLETKKEVSKYFNEAKLNLIILLLLFESIKKLTIQDKKKILVLDDFITSLDVSNRTFLMEYIFNSFSEFQILIFTHNVYFYNLIMYLVNDIYNISMKWINGNLYEINNNHNLYIKGKVETVSKIRTYYQNNGHDIDGTGNKIRQRFEVLLYEFSKLLMIGSVEDSKKIIENIENGKAIYFKNKVPGTAENKHRTASDLITELEEILNSKRQSQTKHDLKEKINEYKKDNLNNFQKIIKKLKLYQKVTMHPMSHGNTGQTSFTIAEIEQSLDYLQKFELTIKDLVNSTVDGA